MHPAQVLRSAWTVTMPKEISETSLELNRLFYQCNTIALPDNFIAEEKHLQ